MAVPLVTLADSQQDGTLLTVDLATAWQIATQGPSALEQVVNAALVQAEQNAPEGAWLLLDLQGWTIPLIGNVGPQVADQIQQAWANGQITYSTGPEAGQPIERWPVDEFGGRFAVYDANLDSVRINAVKRQGPIITIILIVLGVLVGIALLQSLFGLFGARWTLSQGVQPITKTPPPSGGLAGWWATLPFLDKAAIVTAGLGGLVFLIYVWGESRIAAAGAARSEQTIIVEK
jgi:hypothetical protein